MNHQFDTMLYPRDVLGDSLSVNRRSYEHVIKVTRQNSPKARAWLREQRWAYGKSLFSSNTDFIFYGFDEADHAILFKLAWSA